jgi:hypothetical protein
MDEGLASFLPVAMVEQGFLSLKPFELEEVKRHWGYRYNTYKRDIILENDFRGKDEQDRQLYYSKTFKLQYLLYKELGPENYRKLVIEYLKVGNNITNKNIIKILNKYKKINWKKFLSGWVFAGSYGEVGLSDFTDQDGDLLLTFEEKYEHTDPLKSDSDGDLLPDGYELFHGLNPRVKDPASLTISHILKNGPFADGDGREWEYLPYFEVKLPIEQKGVGEYGMNSIKITINNGYLCFLVDTNKIVKPHPKYMFDILLDMDFDLNADVEYAFWLDETFIIWQYTAAEAKSVLDKRLEAGRNHSLELKVPISLLPIKEAEYTSVFSETPSFQILPIIRDDNKKINVDEWPGWVPVTMNILEAVVQYKLQTDLQATDMDKDGIPDLYEIVNNFNPTKKNDPGDIKKIGPFMDGSSECFVRRPASAVSVTVIPPGQPLT